MDKSEAIQALVDSGMGEAQAKEMVRIMSAIIGTKVAPLAGTVEQVGTEQARSRQEIEVLRTEVQGELRATASDLKAVVAEFRAGIAERVAQDVLAQTGRNVDAIGRLSAWVIGLTATMAIFGPLLAALAKSVFRIP
jgi:hypothetical protein